MRTFILQRFHVYGRVCLIFALAASPTIFNRKTQDVFNLLKFNVLWTAGLAALMFFLIWAAERGVWPPRANLFIAAGVFLGTCVVATLFSTNPLLSVFGLYHRYGGLVPFTLYALIMLAIVGLYWEKPQDLKDLAKGSSIASVLLLAYCLIQAAGQDWIAWKDSSGGPPPYPVGTMGNSNFAGGYLGIAVPFLVYVAITAKQDVNKTILYVLTGLDLLALWFTQTRGGMIAAAAGLLTMAFLLRDRLPRWLRWSAVASLVLGVFLAVMVLFHPGTEKPIGPLAKIETLRTGTFEVRTYYWATAVRIFKERPITGVGLDLYYANYPKYRLPEDGSQLGLTITDKPHNIFLEYLANGGILTFLAYLALVGLAMWYGMRRLKTIEDPQRTLLVAFIAVLAGYLAQGVFSIDVPPLAVMGWVGIAGIAAIADPRVERARSQMSADKAPRGKGKKAKTAEHGYKVKRHGNTLWLVHVPVALLVAVLVFMGTRPVLADAEAKTAQTVQQQRGSDSEIETAYDRAIELNPWEASYRSQVGAYHETSAAQSQDPSVKLMRFKKAEEFYAQALRLQPGNIFYMMNHARLYTSWAEIDPSYFPKADQWWGRVVRHDPTDWDVHNRYALMLNSYANAKGGESGLRERTLEQLEATVKIKPDLASAWVNIAKVHLSLGRPDKAEPALQKALSLEPSNEEADRLLRSLETRS